jgi:hypothetical protein
MRSRLLVLALLVAAGAIGGVIWWKSREAAPPPAPVATAPIPEEPAVEVTPPPAPTPEAAPGPAAAPVPVATEEAPVKEHIVLPALAESDPFVRERLLALSPKLALWLNRDGLVRRFAVVMDNAAVGDMPRRQLAFLAPTGPFRVLHHGHERFVMDPKGFARYDRFVDVFTSVPPEGAAALLTAIAPLLTQALLELGQPAEEPLESSILPPSWCSRKRGISSPIRRSRPCHRSRSSSCVWGRSTSVASRRICARWTRRSERRPRRGDAGGESGP